MHGSEYLKIYSQNKIKYDFSVNLNPLGRVPDIDTIKEGIQIIYLYYIIITITGSGILYV